VKLAHLADIHLGFRQYHRQTPRGLNQREADVANAFRLAIDGVIAKAPEIVVVAGDLFHSVRPTNQAILFAFQQFHRLRQTLPKTRIVLIAGNHDSPRSVETGSILRLFDALDMSVVAEGSKQLDFEDLDASVLAVAHDVLLSPGRPAFRLEKPRKHQILVLHGEVEGIFPSDRSAVEYGGGLLRSDELNRAEWSYVALGHYHVQHEVAPRRWYSGALEYVSSNPWGELHEEARRNTSGKGWLLVDLDRGTVERQPVRLARRVLDLPQIEGAGFSAGEIDRELLRAIGNVPNGISDQIVRQVIRNVPRGVGRELNHQSIRSYKADALHFQLDLRRPETHREIGLGAPGRRQTLPELVEAYLSGRALPADLDRKLFVETGTGIMAAVERDWTEG
jgi:hypothetical protein